MRRRHGRTRREREGGFALLLVFAMAAVIGIMLYMELPRLAFQVQRQKEQMLMERGQQYQLAIRRYMQRGLRGGVNQVVGPPWPAKIEDLENTSGRRFLRKRYLDPMTGTDEWRFIHINNGVLTDSVNNKQQKNQPQEAMRTSGITEFASIGQAPATPSGAGLTQMRRRPSDNPGSNGGGTFDPNAPGNAADSGGASTLPGGSPGVLPVPVPFPVPPQLGAGGNPGRSGAFGPSTLPGMPPGFSPGMPPGQPQYPGQLGNPANSNNTDSSPYPNGQGPGGNSPFFQQPGGTTGQQLSAQQMIGNLLTQPRPGGMPTAVPNTNSTLGGGIAGVASKLDDDSIMVCGDHSNYTEWEFIFDPSKWRGPADPRKALVGTPAGNSPSGSNPSTNPTAGPGSAPFPQPGAGATGGPTIGSPPAQNQNRPGAQGGNLGTTCGMEARPGIQ